MLVKLIHGCAGEYQSFRPRQVIKVSDETGTRFLASGIATDAPKGAQAEGELIDEHPDPEVQAEGLRLRAAYLEQQERKAREREAREKAGREKADAPQADTPESRRAAADGICAGTTGAGNPCAKKAVAGSKYCAAHADKG